MKIRTVSLGLVTAALLAAKPAPAAISSVIGWWHLGETGNPQADSSGNTNNVNYRSAFSAGPNAPLVAPVISPEAVGGPLGTNGFVSTSSARFGLNATQTTYWNTTTNPPASNYCCELWFLPQNKGMVGGSVSWVFTTGGADVNVPGSAWGGEVVRIKDNFDGTSSLQAGMIFGNNSADVTDFGPAVFVDTNRWIHLALVNIGGTTYFYTNGVPCGTNDTGITYPAAGDMFIGTDGDNQSIDGFVDEERLFTFAPGQFSTNDLLLRALPSLIVQPATNTTVWNGGAVAFNVGVSRDPGNTFQWQRGVGTNLLGDTASSLYLPQVATADSGSLFDCVVSNVNNTLSITTSNAMLTIVPVQTNNVAAYRSAVTSEPSLVAFFPMDGDTGSTVSNTVDNAHNGFLELNADFDGRTNRSFGERALSLDGDGDVQIPNNPAYEFGSGNGTVEGLVYLTTPVTPGYVVPANFTIFSMASSDGSTVHYQIQASADGNTLIYTNDSPIQLTWAVPVSLLNRLAHVAIVFSNGTNVTPYVDGASLGSKAQVSFGGTTGVPAWIGSASTNVPGLWVGTIDELAVYTSALPGNTIAIHNSKFLFGTNTSAPVITSLPGSATLYAGGSPVLSVTAVGTPPITYQWKTNGTPISGATNSSLTLPNTTTNSSATYSVTINNPIAPTNSTGILLTFVTPPAGYAAKVMGDDPTAYWRLDESSGSNMFDFAGVLNGVYSNNGTNPFTLGAPGIIPGDTAVNFIAGSKGEVPYSKVLNTSGAFTVEFWAKPASVGQNSPLASQFRSGSARSGIVFYHHFDAAGWEYEMGNGSGIILDLISPIPVAVGNWYHVAAVYDGTNTATLYVNGETQATGTSSSYLPNPSAPFEIGIRNGAAVTFNGTLDEVAFYNYALTQSQLQGHVDIGLPLRTAIAPATNVIADSKPVGDPSDGINTASTWLASSSDGTVTRNGVQSFTYSPASQITVLGYSNFDAPQGTFTFWMRAAPTVTTNNGNEAAIIFDRRPGGGAGGFVIVQEDAGTVVCQGANNITPNLGTAASVSDTNWHHIAVVYDQTLTGFTAIYVDGALSASNVNVVAWSWTAGAALEFGQDTRYDGGYWRNYNGLLDDVRIYNRLLTPTEISSIFTSDALVDTNALTLRLNFDAPPNGYAITWGYGTLQAAPAATGTYSNLFSAQFAPFPVAPHSGGAKRFFRAVQ